MSTFAGPGLGDTGGFYAKHGATQVKMFFVANPTSYAGLTWMKNVFVMTVSFWDTSWSTPFGWPDLYDRRTL